MQLIRPIQTRFRYGFTCNGLTLLHKLTRWLIMQKVRDQAFLLTRHSPLTACRHGISDSISLPLTGFFSPFPYGTMRYR